MTDTIPTAHGDLVVWTTADPQSLPAASAAMMTSVANALDATLGTYATAALLLADSPTSPGYYTADNAPGGFFYWSGSSWSLTGVARVTSTSLISGQSGWLLLLTTTGVTYRHNGSAWKQWESDWIPYTPTLTAGTGSWVVGTGGNAQSTAFYRFDAGLLSLKGRQIFGTSGSTIFGAQPRVSLPSGVTLVAPAIPNELLMSSVTIFDAGVSVTAGTIRYASTAVDRVEFLSGVGTVATITNAAPFAWGAGDGIAWQATDLTVA